MGNDRHSVARVWLACLLFGLFSTGVVSAALIDESTNVVLDASDNAVLSLKLFDPSLGHLQSVQITVTGLLTGDWSYDNSSHTKSSSPFTATYILDQTLDVTQGAQSYLAMSDSTTSNGVAIPALAPGAFAAIPSVNTNSTRIIVYNTAPTLASFIGLGQIAFSVASTENESVTVTRPPNTSQVLLGVDSEETATIDIQYTYTVAAVPEPGTSELLGLGCIGLVTGWWLRKKRALQANVVQA